MCVCVCVCVCVLVCVHARARALACVLVCVLVCVSVCVCVCDAPGYSPGYSRGYSPGGYSQVSQHGLELRCGAIQWFRLSDIVLQVAVSHLGRFPLGPIPTYGRFPLRPIPTYGRFPPRSIPIYTWRGPTLRVIPTYASFPLARHSHLCRASDSLKPMGPSRSAARPRQTRNCSSGTAQRVPREYP